MLRNSQELEVLLGGLFFLFFSLRFGFFLDSVLRRRGQEGRKEGRKGGREEGRNE